MSNYFKNATFNFTCPTCSNSFEVSISSIGKSINCPHCNQGITFEDDGFNNGLQDANAKINNFTNNLKDKFNL